MSMAASSGARPESGPGLGQQLNPANIPVSTIWSVSPGGKLVAYAEAGTGRIHIIRSDGQEDMATSSFSAICRDNALCTDYPPSLVWSPNGRYIAYQSSDGTLHLLTVDGTSDQAVSAGQQGIVTSLLWSSDSQQLAFVAEPPGLNGQAESIWSFNPTSGSLTQVAASPDPANSAATIRKIYWLAQHPASYTHLDRRGGELSVAHRHLCPRARGRVCGRAADTSRIATHRCRLYTPPGRDLAGRRYQARHPGRHSRDWHRCRLTARTAGHQCLAADNHQWSLLVACLGIPLPSSLPTARCSSQLTTARSCHQAGSSQVTGTPVWSADGSHLATPLNMAS